MELSKDFKLEEFTYSAIATKNGIDNTPSSYIIRNLVTLCGKILQPIRDKYGFPIRITSGYRSPRLNRMIGGAVSSQHLNGEAADIIAADNTALWRLITGMISDQEIEVGQLIDEKNLSWIHLSLPSPRFRNMIFKLD